MLNTIISLLVFILALSPSAWGMKKSTFCESILFSMRDELGTHSHWFSQTGDAFNSARMFRLRLSQEEPRINYDEVRGSSRDGDSPSAHVLGRLKSLEQTNRDIQSKDGGAKLQIGMTLEGDEILSFLDDIHGQAQNIEATIERLDQMPQFPVRREKFLLGMASFSTALFTTAFLSNLALDGALTPGLALSSIFVPMYGPENLVRYFRSLEFGFNDFQNSARRFVSGESQETWRVDSRNFWLPPKIVNDLWIKGELGENVIEQNGDEIQSLAGRWIKNRKGISVYRSTSMVLIDRILFRDSLTDPPKMILFARVTDGRPRVPQVKPSEAQSPSEALAKAYRP